DRRLRQLSTKQRYGEMAKKSSATNNNNGNVLKLVPEDALVFSPGLDAESNAIRREFCQEVVAQVQIDDKLADALLTAICEDEKALFDAERLTLINVVSAIAKAQRCRLIDDRCRD